MRFSRRTRVAGIALVAASSLVLAACGSGDDDSSSADDNIIKVYGTNPQNPLIPSATNEVGGGDPINNLFAGLVAYNSDGSIENEVAESIEGNDNNTVWTIKLKDDQKFTDGTPVTAESFVNAWNYGAVEANTHLNNYFYTPFKGTDDEGYTVDGAEEISGLKIIDEKTFEATLKEPEVDFPLRLGYSAYFPIPEAAFGDDGKYTKEYGEKPIGNGPYKLTDTGWERNKQIAMEPNPDYDGPRKPKNEGLVFKFYAGGGAESAYTDVSSNNGNLDVLDQVPPSTLNTFEKDDKVQAFNEPGSNFASITIPERLKHFSGEEGDLRRKAISMAFNRAEVTEKIYNNTRTPASDFTSPAIQGFTEDVPGNEVLEFNESEAKKLWAEADAIQKWTGSFQIAFNEDGAGNKEFVEALTNQVKNTLEIDASPKAYPTFDELRKQVTDKSITTAFRTGWQADYPSLLNYLGPLYGTGAGSNDGDYSNEDFDRLYRQASASDGEERFKLITEAQAILMEDLPALPLWYANATAAVSKDVKGFEFNWQQKPDYYKLTK